MFQLFTYSARFKKPFRTASGILTNREILVLYYEENGIQAFGESAPLPGFSTESIEDSIQFLKSNTTEIHRSLQSTDPVSAIQVLLNSCPYPSVQFGLHAIAYDIIAKRKQLPLYKVLNQASSSTIQANAVLGITEDEELLRASLKKIVMEGFGTIKLKVGMNWNQELKILKQIRNEYPKLKIRIDANQAWQKDEAITNLNDSEALTIEYCEQPIDATNLKSLKKISERSNVLIAADESIRTLSDATSVITTKITDLIILKPVLFGSFNNLIVTKELADSHNVDVILTTSFDGIIGRTFTSSLAAAFGSKKYAHGLATGNHLLENGLLYPQEIMNGEYILPNAPGVGIPIDLNLITSLI